MLQLATHCALEGIHLLQTGGQSALWRYGVNDMNVSTCDAAVYHKGDDATLILVTDKMTVKRKLFVD